MKRDVLCVLLFVGELLAAPRPASAYAFRYDSPWYCNGNPVRHNGHEALTPACALGATVSLQTGTLADQTENAWREWWNLDTTNPAVWVRRDVCGPSSNRPGANDGINVALASSTATPWGYSWVWSACDVGATPFIDEVDINAWSGAVSNVSECAHQQVTYDGTWLHELGHGYGYEHFDDWLSTMNTFTPDISSCTPTRRARPSSDAQQAHDALYGIVNAFDYGSTPMVQIGSTVSSGVVLPASETSYPLNTNTSRTITLDLTRMNMRDAWPNSTVNYRVYLSSDRVLSADDAFVADQSLNWGLFAGAIYRMTVNVSFVPTVVLAPGARKCFLIKWDAWGGSVVEAREDDNVMDMDICVTRSTT